MRRGGSNTRKQQQRKRRRLSLFVCRARSPACLPALCVCSLRFALFALAQAQACETLNATRCARERQRGRVAWFLLTSYVTHIRVSFRNKSKRKKSFFFSFVCSFVHSLLVALALALALRWLLEKRGKKNVKQSRFMQRTGNAGNETRFETTFRVRIRRHNNNKSNSLSQQQLEKLAKLEYTHVCTCVSLHLCVCVQCIGMRFDLFLLARAILATTTTITKTTTKTTMSTTFPARVRRVKTFVGFWLLRSFG